MGQATFNWRYKSGSILPNGVVIPTTADNVKPALVTYVAHWGNDITGNGSRERPFRTPNLIADNSGNIILASGVYRISTALNSQQNYWFGDGNVVLDCSYANLAFLFNDTDLAINYRFNNVTFKGSGTTVLSKGIYNQHNYGIIENCVFDGVSPSAVENVGDTYILRNCIIKNINRGIVVNRGIDGNVNYGVNRNTNRNNTYVNCRGINISGFNYDSSGIFYNCNINFTNAVTLFGCRYSLFHNCNFRINTTPLTGSIYPSLPTGFVYYTSIETLKNAIISFFPETLPTVLSACIFADPKFNNVDIGDLSLAFDSPAKTLSYFGTFVGANSIAQNLKVRSSATTSDFDNATAVNLTIADDSLTLTDVNSIASIVTKPISNLAGREISKLPVYGLTADRNGEVVDSTSDLATSTIAADTTLLTSTPYIVEVGSITYNSVFHTPGSRFTSLTASPGTFTTSTNGVLREILEAPARENLEVRFSEGASGYTASGSIVSGNWYFVELQSITYDAVTYVAGSFLKGTATTTFTGSGSARQVFASADPFSFFEINQKPASNNVGNSRTGAIVRGNGDKDFDRTTANVFPITQKFIQLKYTIQVNNLAP